jgi:hypothetical protein
LVVTVPAVTVNVPVVAPAATVIELGVVSAALLSERVTVDPPDGAACNNVTVQVALAPKFIEVGEQASVVIVRLDGVTVTEAVVGLPLSDAVTVTA